MIDVYLLYLTHYKKRPSEYKMDVFYINFGVYQIFMNFITTFKRSFDLIGFAK